MSDEKDEPRIEKNRWEKWECYPCGNPMEILIGGDEWVEIDKLFGPQCSSKIRVKHDIETCTWVIEEKNFNNDEWVERARFDAQEFYKPEYSND